MGSLFVCQSTNTSPELAILNLSLKEYYEIRSGLQMLQARLQTIAAPTSDDRENLSVLTRLLSNINIEML